MIQFVSLHFYTILVAAGTMMLLGLAAFLLFRLKLYRATGKPQNGMTNTPAADAITVVICSHNEGDHLETNLPKIMEQRGVNFEVVVVDDCSNDSTHDVLKRFENRYPNLRHTFVPKTARYVSHTKLAVSLGVKAARNNWVVLTRPSCIPVTDLWLKTMAACFADGTDIVIGYANYADNGTFPARRAIFERLQYNLLWFLSARKRAIGGDGANLAFRRAAFLDADGYADSLDRLFGEDDLLVNAISSHGNATICTARTATVREFNQSMRRKWRNSKLTRTASLMQFPRNGSVATIALRMANTGHFLWLAGWIVAAATLFVSKMWLAGAAVCLAALIVTVADILMMRRVSRMFGERTFIFSLLWYETARPLFYPLWKLRARLRSRDFIRKF